MSYGVSILVFTANVEDKNPTEADFIPHDNLTETNLVDWAKAQWGQEGIETAVTNKTTESSWISEPWNSTP